MLKNQLLVTIIQLEKMLIVLSKMCDELNRCVLRGFNHFIECFFFIENHIIQKYVYIELRINIRRIKIHRIKINENFLTGLFFFYTYRIVMIFNVPVPYHINWIIVSQKQISTCVPYHINIPYQVYYIIFYLVQYVNLFICFLVGTIRFLRVSTVFANKSLRVLYMTCGSMLLCNSRNYLLNYKPLKTVEGMFNGLSL